MEPLGHKEKSSRLPSLGSLRRKCLNSISVHPSILPFLHEFKTLKPEHPDPLTISKEEPGRAPVASREFMGNLGEIPLRAEASALESTFGRFCLYLFVGSGYPKLLNPKGPKPFRV